MNGITWRCHICKEVRPDDRISVMKHRSVLDGGVEVTENVRYCNDRMNCEVRALQFHHIVETKRDLG